MAGSGLPDRRGVAGARRTLDASRDSDHASKGRERHAAPDPDRALGARAGPGLDPRVARSGPTRSRALDLHLQARGDVRALVRELRGAAAPDAGRLRHLRPEARPDRDAGRDVPLEGRGRARAGGRTRPRRRRRGSCRSGTRARGVALPDGLGGLAARSVLADPATPGRAGTAFEAAARSARRVLRIRLLLGRLGRARARDPGRGRSLEGRARARPPLRRYRLAARDARHRPRGRPPRRPADPRPPGRARRRGGSCRRSPTRFRRWRRPSSRSAFSPARWTLRSTRPCRSSSCGEARA